eukprot:TRINITY_DN22449_c0_g1_i1.p1 TRINITY_DN22449_c0_g1~~TRINITY_DN22449_c0_g1_i1.p1  ORF type:complete len:140 (+),score=27.74 TRINITY_DN22449_c0_g1_i1:43-420(+)
MSFSDEIQKLEEYFQRDDVQESISKFMHGTAMVNTVFVDADIGKEQQHQSMEIYKKYCEMIDDELIKEFLTKNCDLKLETLAEELASIEDANDKLVCAPYIAAGVSFENFIFLMKQWSSSYDEGE